MLCAKAILSDTDPPLPPQLYFPATATTLFCPTMLDQYLHLLPCVGTWGTNPPHSLNTSTQRSSTITETFFGGSKTAVESQVPFPLACLHLTSPSPSVPPIDLRIDVAALWMRCNLQQRAETNIFSYIFFPTKLIFCYAYKAKLSTLIPSLLPLQQLLQSARSAALTFFSLLFGELCKYL